MRHRLFFSVTFLFLFLLAWTAIAPRTFFSSDVGLRFLQIQELVDQRWQTFAIAYPAHDVDPELKRVPYYYAYSVLESDLYLNISPFFPLLASFFYVTLGTLGLPITPALGSALTAWATYRLICLSELPNARLAWISVLFATPLLFYGMVLWDHSLGAACALWALYGVAAGLIENKPGTTFLGGAVAGLALGQRPELYLFAVAVGLALLWASRGRLRPCLWFVLGGLAGALPIWWLQYRWVGHPLGMALAPHLLGYGAPAHPVLSSEVPWLTKLTHFFLHTEPRSPWQGWATVLIIAGNILLISAVRWATWAARLGWVIGLLLTIMGYGLLIWIAHTSSLIGIVSTFPLLPFGLLALTTPSEMALRQRLVYRLVWATGLGFLILILLTWPGYGGLQWGARYLLPLYPLLLILAWYGYHTQAQRYHVTWQPFLRSSAALLLLLALLLQGMGAYRIYKDHGKHQQIRAELLAMPVEFIATNHLFMPSFMTALNNQQSFLYVRNNQELNALLARLAEQGITRLGVVSLPGPPLESKRVIGEYIVEQQPWPAQYLVQAVFELKE